MDGKMNNYKKAKQLVKLLEDSGVNFVIAYGESADKHAVYGSGSYSKLKCYVVDIMVHIAKNVCSRYGEGIAHKELVEMALLAAEQLHEENKLER